MLRFNFGKCKDWDKLKKQSAMNEVFIWAGMFTGIPNITKTNYKEYYARISLGERLFGKYLGEYITLDDVERRIGLTTNASGYSKRKFLDLVYKRYLEDIK